MPETKQTKQPPKASPALPAPRPAALPVPAKALTALERFYQELRRIPKLDREEEERLARLWREKRDYAAGQRLILHGLHTVAAIAREYRHFGLPEEDLIQEGVLGLMHAINRFDPDRGFRLSTYASWWIRAAIHDYILRSWSIVKVGTTKLQRRIFAGLQRAKHAIAALEGKNLEEVAEHYGLEPHEYQAIANLFLQRDVSVDAENDEGASLIQALPAPDPTPEEIVAEVDAGNHARERLEEALGKLNARERRIVERRYLKEPGATLRELAEEFGVSIERVRQLEMRALRKLRAAMSG